MIYTINIFQDSVQGTETTPRVLIRISLVTIIKSTILLTGHARGVSGIWFHHKCSCKSTRGNAIGITTEATTKLPHTHRAGY